ncbi:MAG: helix-turn-helix transcriptional regulator [Eubacterium sp.]|nr:helix-turn-helix transcriptional regulator [Eubacterium sp.]MCM1418889.1 helix-turn-helix transcriptional regulator [Roseburia sp.]
MLKYKADVLAALKAKGYSSYTLRQENLLGNSCIQSLRSNQMVGISSLDKICALLECQPGELIEHVPDDK